MATERLLRGVSSAGSNFCRSVVNCCRLPAREPNFWFSLENFCFAVKKSTERMQRSPACVLILHLLGLRKDSPHLNITVLGRMWTSAWTHTASTAAAARLREEPVLPVHSRLQTFIALRTQTHSSRVIRFGQPVKTVAMEQGRGGHSLQHPLHRSVTIVAPFATDSLVAYPMKEDCSIIQLPLQTYVTDRPV